MCPPLNNLMMESVKITFSQGYRQTINGTKFQGESKTNIKYNFGCLLGRFGKRHKRISSLV